MEAIEITVTGIDGVFEGAENAILAGVLLGLEEIGFVGQALVSEGAPKGFTGNLAHTVFPHLEQNADVLTEIITNGPPADMYSAPVNFGARPHFPPYEDLIPWVKLKFGLTDEKTARSMAFLVARKISRMGTDPNGFYDRAFEQLKGKAQGILDEKIGEAVEKAGFHL